METVDAGEIKFSLRIPSKLNEKIIADADKKRRSRQQHIVYLLEQIFETPSNGNGKKEAKK